LIVTCISSSCDAISAKTSNCIILTQLQDQTSPHTNLSYHLTTLPPQTEADIENDMDYLSKKDSRSGIEPYPNHGVHVPNASLIRFDANGEYALNLPLVQGTVVGYSPPLNESISNTSQDGEFETERQKENDALYRILWDGSSDGVGYLEDVTLKELLALKRPDRQSQALAVHKSVRATAIRERLTLQWKMESLLTKLVVLAGLELRKEIGQKVRLELLLERKRLRDAADGMEKGRGGTKSRGEINADGNEFEYYLKHPNQVSSTVLMFNRIYKIPLNNCAHLQHFVQYTPCLVHEQLSAPSSSPFR
jgi:hypothetical protein